MKKQFIENEVRYQIAKTVLLTMMKDGDREWENQYKFENNFEYMRSVGYRTYRAVQVGIIKQ